MLDTLTAFAELLALDWRKNASYDDAREHPSWSSLRKMKMH